MPTSDWGRDTKFSRLSDEEDIAAHKPWFSRQRGPPKGHLGEGWLRPESGGGGEEEEALTGPLLWPQGAPPQGRRGRPTAASWEQGFSRAGELSQGKGQLVRPRRICSSDSPALRVLTLTTGKVAAAAAPSSLPALPVHLGVCREVGGGLPAEPESETQVEDREDQERAGCRGPRRGGGPRG